MDLFEQILAIDVHDSTVKKLTFGFDGEYIGMEVNFYQEQIGEYILDRWTFKKVSHVSLVGLEVLCDDLEIFSFESHVDDENAKRVTFQFLQGPGRPSATLSFVCKEASSEHCD